MATIPAGDARAQLILSVIDGHFGAQTCSVAAVLLVKGGATLQTLLAQFCAPQVPTHQRLSKEVLCSSLLVLQQHCCLILEQPPDFSSIADVLTVKNAKGANARRKAPAAVIYMIDTDMVLNRLRIGRVIYHASKTLKLDRIGELVIEEIFMNGRQTFQQLRADVDARASNEAKKEGSNQTLNNETRYKQIHSAFDSLVKHGLIVRIDELHVVQQIVLKLPARNRGKKGSGSASTFGGAGRKGRYSDDEDEDEDEDEEDEDGLGADDKNGHSKFSRLRRKRAAINLANGSRFAVGDGEWKEEACGFGPLTEERIYDADAEARARSLELASLSSSLTPMANAGAEPKMVNIKIEDLTGIDDDAALGAQKVGSSAHVTSHKKNVVLSDDDDDDDDDNDDDDDDDKGDIGVGGGVSSSGRGRKRKATGSATDAALSEQKIDVLATAAASHSSSSSSSSTSSCQQYPPSQERAGLFSIGWKQLVLEETKVACVRFASERINTRAGKVLRAILDVPNCQLNTPVAPATTSAASSAARILEQYERQESVADLDLATLKKILQMLVNDYTVEEVAGVDGGAEYRVAVGEIISKLRRKTVQSIAVARFGIPTARIVEMLTTRDEFMEQQRVSDVAIMPAREAKENLFKLYKDRWIDYREVNKRLDFSSSSSLYFWKIDQKVIRQNILDHCFRAILNMRNRFVAAHIHHSVSYPFNSHPPLPSTPFLRRRMQIQLDELTPVNRYSSDKSSSNLASSISSSAMSVVDRLDKAVVSLDQTVLIFQM